MSINHTSNLNEIKALVELRGGLGGAKSLMHYLGRLVECDARLHSYGSHPISRKAIEKYINQESDYVCEITQGGTGQPKSIAEMIDLAKKMAKSIQAALNEAPVDGNTRVVVFADYDAVLGLVFQMWTE